MSGALRAMATWIGALARGGLLMGRDEEEGALLALEVLGEEGLSRLRTEFARSTPADVLRERTGAVHACIWMAQADRQVVEDEVRMLEQIIAHSDLPLDVQEDLASAIVTPQRPERFAEELTQPELRELIVALGWRLAAADGRIDDEEVAALDELGAAFGIARQRSHAIRDAVLESDAPDPGRDR